MGTQNTLGDLNNHLFAQLERLNEEDLSGDELKDEMNRAKAITSVANQVISNAALVLDAKKLIGDSLNADVELPRMLDVK